METIMKSLLKIALTLAALSLAACAHERTEMDRELALKLVDKAGRIEIVQSGGAPLINPSPAQHGPWEDYQRQPASPSQSYNPTEPTSKTCRHQKMFDLNGNYTYTDVVCY